jgi:hypothetical protein
MVKKIKSFTVDENVYNRLISMFKEHGAETSISMYLNNQVKWLLEHLEDLENGIREKNYSIPMSYVIDEIVKNAGRSGRLSDETHQKEFPVSELEMILNDWQEQYDAYKEGIPYEYYTFLKSGNYVLSLDKKFIIAKGTGKKYVSQGKNKLMEVREIDPENYS